jgi:IS605 OrfB family transposase
MKSFFGSLKAKVKKVKLPRYLKKDGLYSLFDRMVYKPNDHKYIMPRSNFIKAVNQDIKEINQKLLKHTNKLSLTEIYLNIKTPKWITNNKIKEITIKPVFDGKFIEVIYVYQDLVKANRYKKIETMGIDFGYQNLATLATTNNQPLIIDGNELKSYNQLYHKVISKLASSRVDQNRLTNKMIKVIDKRNRRMTYGINKAARLIINHAVFNDVGTIIIGYNDNFKDESLSKQYNQWTKSIPIARLRDRIIFLAKAYNIETKVINEAYTSISSYLDKDLLTKSDFSGKRIKRGLYQSKSGQLINADLNAALNIIKKGNPDALWIENRGLNTPKRTYLFE